MPSYIYVWLGIYATERRSRANADKTELVVLRGESLGLKYV